jgi:3',5'-nucleoside bisphosphate phosphatase
MLKPYLADLHIHTVLSACAEVEMIPPLIAAQALHLGLSLIAVTDHNACDNVAAVMEAAAGTGLHVLPGMELQTREEVHLLCLFDTIASCRLWQAEVFRQLPPLTNRVEIFGSQFVVDATGEWIRTEERLLATSTEIPLREAVVQVRSLGGIAIPSHVDRPSYSLLFNLGFVPVGLEIEGLEVTPRFVPASGFERWPELRSFGLVVNGDAHRLGEISNRTLFKIAAPVTGEIAKALRGEDGRRVVVEWPTA